MAATMTRPIPRGSSGRWWARLLIAVVIASLLAAVAIPPLVVVAWRDRRLAEVATPEAVRDWEAFREDMRRQSGRDGPVQRKVPKSAEPPELVWLRDYLPLAIVAWVTLVGTLGGFLAAIAAGIARGSSATEHGTARDRHDEKEHEADSKHADEG